MQAMKSFSISVISLFYFLIICDFLFVWSLEQYFKFPSRTFKKPYCCCSVTKLCPTLCDPMNCSTPGFPVLHYLPEFAQTYAQWVSEAIQWSHPLSPPSPLALNLSQHLDLSQWKKKHLGWIWKKLGEFLKWTEQRRGHQTEKIMCEIDALKSISSKRERSQIIKIINESRDITTDSTEIKMIERIIWTIVCQQIGQHR